jgi:hypothetical protein
MARRIGLSLVILMAVLLSGCIKPVNTTGTPTPTYSFGIPANPVTSAAPLPPSSLTLVDAFTRGRGEMPTNLQLWYDQAHGPDRLQGFSYTNASGQICAGFLLAAPVADGWQPNNGAIVCATQPSVQALASTSLFATTDGQPYTIVFGRVEDPTVTAVSVLYSDGSSLSMNPVSGGFLLVAPGILGVNVITAVNQLGNTVIQNIPQSPAS